MDAQLNDLIHEGFDWDTFVLNLRPADRARLLTSVSNYNRGETLVAADRIIATPEEVRLARTSKGVECCKALRERTGCSLSVAYHIYLREKGGL
jgi:hypothetical protein